MPLKVPFNISIQRERDMPCHTSPQRKHQIWSEGRSRSERTDQRHYRVSVRKAKRDRVNSLGLASLNNSGGLW